MECPICNGTGMVGGSLCSCKDKPKKIPWAEDEEREEGQRGDY